ncbi:125_t:CDS:2, partial [Gigaspora margarita]
MLFEQIENLKQLGKEKYMYTTIPEPSMSVFSPNSSISVSLSNVPINNSEFSTSIPLSNVFTTISEPFT